MFWYFFLCVVVCVCVEADEAGEVCRQKLETETRVHWIQCITFAAETYAADTHTAWRWASRYFRLLTGSKANKTDKWSEDNYGKSDWSTECCVSVFVCMSVCLCLCVLCVSDVLSLLICLRQYVIRIFCTHSRVTEFSKSEVYEIKYLYSSVYLVRC